jgi:voltage-gated potassium channel Kch
MRYRKTRHHAEHRFRFLLISLVLLLGLQLVARSQQWGALTISLVSTSVFGAALWRLHDQRRALAMGIGLMLLAVVGGLTATDDGFFGVSGSPFHAPFYIYLAITVLYRVLHAERVTEDTIFGAASAYLLLSFAFASAYEAVEIFSPGSIAGLDHDSESPLFAQLSYFSLVTLTTLGFGDFAPVHPFCRSLAILESVVGTMFPALVIARIIAVQSAEKESPFAHPEPEWGRHALVARILFIFLPIAILALPWLEKSAFGRLAVGTILSLLMILGLYFVSGQRRVLVLGGAFLSLAELLRFAGPGWVAVSITIEVLLISFVVLQISRWCLKQPSPTTSVVFSAVSLYWLIGIAFSGIYQLVDQASSATIAPVDQRSVGDMIYFSFMTLTTTGYGDFTPIGASARVLTSLEAFLGIFYPAIVIARLVSLYGSRP